MDDVFSLPEVRERMRLQYDAQRRILDRIADEIELDLPEDRTTEVFRQRFASLRKEIAEQAAKWQ